MTVIIAIVAIVLVAAIILRARTIVRQDKVLHRQLKELRAAVRTINLVVDRIDGTGWK